MNLLNVKTPRFIPTVSAIALVLFRGMVKVVSAMLYILFFSKGKCCASISVEDSNKRKESNIDFTITYVHLQMSFGQKYGFYVKRESSVFLLSCAEWMYRIKVIANFVKKR